MERDIIDVLEHQVNPILGEHRGRAVLVGERDGVVTIRLEGACACCPDASVTFETVVNQILRREIPAIRQVVLDQSEEEELLQIAKRILRLPRDNN